MFAIIQTQAANPCGAGKQQVIINIVPDSYPSETSWGLYDGYTGALLDTGSINSDTICVNSGTCLRFTIYDVFGDGICCSYGIGSYTVMLDTTIVAQGGAFGHSETTNFNCPAGFDCNNPLIASVGNFTAPKPETWYTFTPDTTGLYNITTCGLGTTCDTKIYVYDHCQNLLVAEDNTATIFYNDDACGGFQSLVSAGLQAGLLYYIRIGDWDTACSGQTINWQITYEGAIVGCMDSNSCNYNPLATISDSSCVYPPNVLCPAPDLAVDGDMLRSSLYTDDIFVNNGDCYVNEGCLNGYGNRRLIRFTTHIRNIGDMDYYIGAPGNGSNQFVWDPCHQHWHYVGYAEYLLFDHNQQQVQVGFKSGFCVLDLECGGGGIGKFGCANMGITAGCGDIYDRSLNCQWLDITDVDTGYYTMVVRVNWDRSPDKLGHYEKSYANNWAQVCLRLYYDTAGIKQFDTIAYCPAFVDCAGDTFGNVQNDCNGVCGGSTLRGDLNASGGLDSTDIQLYLSGVTDETLTRTTCNDLNSDNRVTVADASRLMGCRRYIFAYLTNFTNAISAQHLCTFPYSVTDVIDTVTFGLAGVDWLHQYFDISVMNPLCRVMGYELKVRGVTVDSVVNLVSNYTPSVRYSSTGHITELTTEDASLQKQLAPLNFIRVYYSQLFDSTICIEKVIDAVNENYQQVVTVLTDSCLTNHNITTPIINVTDKDLVVIPNPSTGVFDCYLSGTPLTGAGIHIYDALGRLVYQNGGYEGLSNHLFVDLTNHQAGMYLLQINLNGTLITKHLMLIKADGQ